jgi:hypothetical protein
MPYQYSPFDGVAIPENTGTAANFATIFDTVAVSLRGKTIPKFADTSSRDTAHSPLTTDQKRGAIAWVTGTGWTGYNGSAWVPFSNTGVKGGRIDTPAIDSLGVARIPTAQCYFNGQPPTSIVVTSVMVDNAWTFNHGGFDGVGAVIRVWNQVTNVFMPAGQACAFNWIAIKV